MLHFLIYDLSTVRDMFRLPFHLDCPIQNKVPFECFGVVRDRHNFIVPGAGFTKIG